MVVVVGPLVVVVEAVVVVSVVVVGGSVISKGKTPVNYNCMPEYASYTVM